MQLVQEIRKKRKTLTTENLFIDSSTKKEVFGDFAC